MLEFLVAENSSVFSNFIANLIDPKYFDAIYLIETENKYLTISRVYLYSVDWGFFSLQLSKFLQYTLMVSAKTAAQGKKSLFFNEYIEFSKWKRFLRSKIFLMAIAGLQINFFGIVINLMAMFSLPGVESDPSNPILWLDLFLCLMDFFFLLYIQEFLTKYAFKKNKSALVEHFQPEINKVLFIIQYDTNKDINNGLYCIKLNKMFLLLTLFTYGMQGSAILLILTNLLTIIIFSIYFTIKCHYRNRLVWFSEFLHNLQLIFIHLGVLGFYLQEKYEIFNEKNYETYSQVQGYLQLSQIGLEAFETIFLFLYKFICTRVHRNKEKKASFKLKLRREKKDKKYIGERHDDFLASRKKNNQVAPIYLEVSSECLDRISVSESDKSVSKQQNIEENNKIPFLKTYKKDIAINNPCVYVAKRSKLDRYDLRRRSIQEKFMGNSQNEKMNDEQLQDRLSRKSLTQSHLDIQKNNLLNGAKDNNIDFEKVYKENWNNVLTKRNESLKNRERMDSIIKTDQNPNNNLFLGQKAPRMSSRISVARSERGIDRSKLIEQKFNDILSLNQAKPVIDSDKNVESLPLASGSIKKLNSNRIISKVPEGKKKSKFVKKAVLNPNDKSNDTPRSTLDIISESNNISKPDEEVVKNSSQHHNLPTRRRDEIKKGRMSNMSQVSNVDSFDLENKEKRGGKIAIDDNFRINFDGVKKGSRNSKNE